MSKVPSQSTIQIPTLRAQMMTAGHLFSEFPSKFQTGNLFLADDVYTGILQDTYLFPEYLALSEACRESITDTESTMGDPYLEVQPSLVSMGLTDKVGGVHSLSNNLAE
jgi:hypothetical protein